MGFFSGREPRHPNARPTIFGGHDKKCRCRSCSNSGRPKGVRDSHNSGIKMSAADRRRQEREDRARARYAKRHKW